MGRCTVTRWAFVAGLLCFCGCTGPRTFSPFGWMHGSDASQASASTDKTNPLKPADQVASSDDSSSADKESGKGADSKSSDAAGKPVKNGFKTAALDPELRKAVDNELAYEPPEERQRLFNQWTKFDPAFVRELVENHRMARETAENRQNPIKLASAEPGQDRAGQAADLDLEPSPANGSNRTAGSKESMAPIQTAPAGQTPPAGPGAVNPWNDPSDIPAPIKNSSTSTARTGTSGTVTARTTPADTSTAGTATNAADAFDTPSGPGQPGRPIAIVPLADSPGPARSKLAQNDAAVPPSEPAAAPVASPSAAKTDVFAGLSPLDDVPTAAPATAVPAARRTAARGVPSEDSAATASDGLLIQPGVAAPASVISSLQSSSRGTRTSPGSAEIDASAAVAALDGPTATRSAGQPANSASLPDSAQPVQLQLPTDVPSSSAVAAASATTDGPKSPPASGLSTSSTSGSSGAGSASSAPSGLAGLGNRLLGVISPNSTASAARIAAQAGNWHDELQKIVVAAASEAGQTSVGTSEAEKLKYAEKQVQLRMLYLLAGQPAKSLEPISGLDAPDQEFWQQVFWGVSNYFDKTAIADPSDRATQTVTQLRTAVHRLQEKSKLELRNVAFCQKIVNYGNYERVKRDEFTAGQLVLLYAEVENFKSEPTTDGPYRTILKSTVEIFDSRGQSVQSMPFPPTDDLCTNPRRDYYNSYEFAIPQRIGLGPHTLKLTVEDQISQKVATYTVNFTVK